MRTMDTTDSGDDVLAMVAAELDRDADELREDVRALEFNETVSDEENAVQQ